MPAMPIASPIASLHRSVKSVSPRSNFVIPTPITQTSRLAIGTDPPFDLRPRTFPRIRRARQPRQAAALLQEGARVEAATRARRGVAAGEDRDRLRQPLDWLDQL